MEPRNVDRSEQDIAVPQTDPERESFAEAQGWKSSTPASEADPAESGGDAARAVTVMTETTLKPGREADWDRAYRERAADATGQEGWIDLHLLIPEDAPRRRVVVGTWRDRASWKRWHETESFEQTRRVMDEATEDDGSERWFRVSTERTSG